MPMPSQRLSCSIAIMVTRIGWWLVLGGVTALLSSACDGDEPRGPAGSSESGAAGAAQGDGAAGNAASGSSGEDGGAGGHATPGTGGGPDEAGAGGNDRPGTGGAADAGAAGQAGASAGAGGDGSDGLPGDRTFSNDDVLEVRLSLDAGVWEDLEEHGNREQYVSAAGSLGLLGGRATSFAALGLRHKGAYSLHHCWDLNGGVRSYFGECAKLSYKLKFDEYEDGHFDGLTRLNLHASSGDATHLRELVAYRTFRDAGVDAPRAMPARLYINDEFQGLFIAVEEVDGRYAAAHYPDGADGNLFKEIWPNAALSDRDFAAALETNDDFEDVSDMRAFAQAIASTNLNDFVDDVAPYVEVESLLRYVAVDRLLRNWDGITAFYSPFTPHNFFWYHDSGARHRFHLVPWDLDNTLWSSDPYMYPDPGWPVPAVPDITSQPSNCEPRVVWSPASGTYITPPRCDKLLDLLLRSSFVDLARIAGELRTTALGADRMQALADHYRELITPIVAEDPTLDSLAWGYAVDAFADIIIDAGLDFDALLAAGLIEEQGPDLDAVTLDAGLHMGGITNFEFASPPLTPAPIGVETFGDPLATWAAMWNTTEPLSGSADLRFDFTFARGPLPNDEWVNVDMFGAESDVRSYTGIAVLLSSDKARELRVRAYSPVYDEVFGGIWSEFGVNLVVGPDPALVNVDFSALTYPGWARDPWDPDLGQGFPATDEEAKDLVLSRFTGLIFVPQPTLDGAGELTAATETGWLRIDNIHFR